MTVDVTLRWKTVRFLSRMRRYLELRALEYWLEGRNQ